MEKYLNETEKELLALLQYHREKIGETNILQQTLTPEAEKVMRTLDGASDILAEISRQRKEEEAQKLQKLPATCPACKGQTMQNPLYERKDSDGFMRNVFFCQACSTEYLADEPNNDIDFNNWISLCFTRIDKELAKKKNLSAKEKAFHEDQRLILADLLKSFEGKQKAIEGVRKADEALHKMTIQYCHILREARVTGEWREFDTGGN